MKLKDLLEVADIGDMIFTIGAHGLDWYDSDEEHKEGYYYCYDNKQEYTENDLLEYDIYKIWVDYHGNMRVDLF